MCVTKFCLKRDFDYDSLDLKMMNNRRDIYRYQMEITKCNVGIYLKLVHLVPKLPKVVPSFTF